MVLFGGLVRLLTPILAFGGLAILVAANWPDPSNALDGYIIGAVGSALGVIPGVFWADSYVGRKWYG